MELGDLWSSQPEGTLVTDIVHAVTSRLMPIFLPLHLKKKKKTTIFVCLWQQRQFLRHSLHQYLNTMVTISASKTKEKPRKTIIGRSSQIADLGIRIVEYVFHFLDRCQPLALRWFCTFNRYCSQKWLQGRNKTLPTGLSPHPTFFCLAALCRPGAWASTAHWEMPKDGDRQQIAWGSTKSITRPLRGWCSRGLPWKQRRFSWNELYFWRCGFRSSPAGDLEALRGAPRLSLRICKMGILVDPSPGGHQKDSIR